MATQSTSGAAAPAEGASNTLGFPAFHVASERSPQDGAQQGIGQQGIGLQELWSLVAKRRFVVVAGFAVGLALAFMLSLLMVPEYRASATLEIGNEPAKVVEIGNQQSIPMADTEFLETQIALLRSRSLAERVARDLKLGDNPEFANPEASAKARLDQATDTLAQTVVVEPVDESRLVRVGFESSDPDLAAQVSNSFARNFIQSALERRYQANDYARDFLQKRIAEVRARLENSERALVLYAQRQNIVSVANKGSGDSSEGLAGDSLQAASLSAANSELATAQNARVVAENRYLEANRGPATSEFLQSPAIQTMKGQLAQLRSTYAQKRNELQPSHPEMVELQSGIDALQRDINRERGATVAALQADYRAAAAREQELRDRVQRLTGDVLDLRGKTIQYNILQRDVDTNRQLYDALLQRFKEVGVSGGISNNVISIVDLANRPAVPFSPNVPRNLLIGALLGLVAGVALAIGSGLVLSKVKLPSDLERQLSLNPLGVIPLDQYHDIENTLLTPKSALFEAYASLRSQILFSTKHYGFRSMLVTSSAPGEGKTTTSLALAQNFARLGKSTLLVDADLRHPSFHVQSPSGGFAGVLEGRSTIGEAILPTDTEHLSMLPAGATPANPVDLLANGRLAEVVRELQSVYDIVIVDGPPILGLADAPLLASAVDCTICVFRADGIRVPAARNAVERLRNANARILGGVLTMFDGRFAGGTYGYDYSYGADRTDKAIIRIDPTDKSGPPLRYSNTRIAAEDAAGRERAQYRGIKSGTLTRVAQVAFWLGVAASLWGATVAGGVEFWGLTDKMQHIAAFLVLTALAIAAYSRLDLRLVWLGLVAFGGVVELIQLLPGIDRDADLADFMVDTAAITFVVAIAWGIRAMIRDESRM